jgi:protoheme IX farnesyltransferase
MQRESDDRFPALLAATAMGVYLLVLVGATAALSDAAAACTGWPACGTGGWSLPSTTAGYVALGHRVAAVLVGLFVVATTGLAWLTDTDRRVKLALTVATLLFPVQAVLGAVVATAGAGGLRSPLHLAVGVAIFGGFVLALAWELEARTGDPDDAPTDPPVATDGPVPLAGGTGDVPQDGDSTVSQSAAATDTEPDTATAATTAALPDDRLGRLRETALAYVRLTKPRLMWLLCLVAAAAMALAGGPEFTPRTILATLGGGVLAIGASGTFNHVLERDVDRRMQRTSDRPLATDIVSVSHAVAFGVVLAAASLALFASINLLAAALGLTAILFYSVVYTLVLKPNTVQNTVLGGAAGALPALIGWAAVTGEIGLGGLALATVIFLWTPAHFYNLALAYREDYERGGFPMLPVVRGETTTRKHVLLYFGATLAAAAGLAAFDRLGWTYALTSVGFGAVFLWTIVRLHAEQTESAAFRAFHGSNAYLGTLLLAILFDALVV